MKPSDQTLRERRCALRLSLRTVATQMGISAPYLADLELGRRAINPALDCSFTKALAACVRPKHSHSRKVDHFVKAFKRPLQNNEWRVTWPIPHSEGQTYNPDFYCPSLKTFIEAVTSWPNYSCGRLKWRAAIEEGYALRVYWWTGADITDDVMADSLGSEVRNRHGLKNDWHYRNF